MDETPPANAIAELDSICDAFERDILSDDTQNFDIDGEIDRRISPIAPQWQSWLRDELRALVDEHSESDRQLRTPEQIDSESWAVLNRNELFRSLSWEARRSLAQSVIPRDFAAGEMLLRTGQAAMGLFLVVGGTIKVLGVDRDHQRYEIDVDTTGSVLGEMSVLTGHPCSADVIAHSDVSTLFLPLEDAQRLRSEYQELDIALCHLIGDRLGRRKRDALFGKRLGDYRLLDRLGTGAMGIVYAAESVPDNASCAVKMLKHHYLHTPAVIQRFDQEAELLRRLQHPNIVTFRDHFVAFRTRFIAMDLFDGSDLRSVLRDHGPLTESMTLRVLGQIAAGLIHAHESGVLHLDLKPANLLLDRNGRVAIADFGLSYLVASGGENQECVGTPAYMPPEQFFMNDLSPACDWYSFGCLAYELLTGQRLFSSDHVESLMRQKLRVPLPDWPPTHCGEILTETIHSAVHPRQNQRQLDLGELCEHAALVPELASTVHN